MRRNEVAQFDGIVLSDVRKKDPRFREALLAALKLLKDSDDRRFHRVQTRLAYILNCTLAHRGAAYLHYVRTCAIDFSASAFDEDPDYYIGWYACTLVHEATHAVIRTRGISYLPQHRSRIERLCVVEEVRYLANLSRVRPDIAARIHCEFNETNWHAAWASTPTKNLLTVLRRIILE